MREKVIDVAFSYTNLSLSRVIAIAINRRVASTSRNEDGFTFKESEYVFGVALSEMVNHADTNVISGPLST